jgi:hypothetical protein
MRIHYKLVYNPTLTEQVMREPTSCGMTQLEGCGFTGFSGWAVGSPGQCLPAEYGFRAGKGGVNALVVQVGTWNRCGSYTGMGRTVDMAE